MSIRRLGLARARVASQLVGVRLRGDGLGLCRDVCRAVGRLVGYKGRPGSESELAGGGEVTPRAGKKAVFWFGGVEAEFGAGVLTYVMGGSPPS